MKPVIIGFGLLILALPVLFSVLFLAIGLIITVLSTFILRRNKPATQIA